MIEQKWLTTDDYTEMMRFLGERMSKRKRLLFGCATARLVWHRLRKRCNRQAIEITERHADDLATRKEMAAAYQNLKWEPAMWSEWHIVALTDGLPYRDPSAEEMARLQTTTEERLPLATRTMQWADALRDLVHNPFRPLRFDPAWRTTNDRAVLHLAQTIYDERRWEDLPLLADALEDAGCNESEVLVHCRQPGSHFRGCWLVDLVLGRT
jgi:hypothetical protein